MAGILSWFQSNWSSVIGAAGIIGSLLFTAASVRADAKNRAITNLLALDERHRALWGEVKQRPELKRILSEKVDIAAQPLTPEEDVSMWQIIQQFETGWQVERILNRGELKLLARDAGDFFRLPLPRAVWEKIKEFRNPKFVRFVERALDRHGRLTGTGA
ncbi:MAG: hypothetical protein WCK27_00685 [Verrucomicrobiota bacterium]